MLPSAKISNLLTALDTNLAMILTFKQKCPVPSKFLKASTTTKCICDNRDQAKAFEILNVFL